jgi:hypothetical protein
MQICNNIHAINGAIYIENMVHYMNAMIVIQHRSYSFNIDHVH